MAVEVAGNGVLFRLATDDEVRVLTRAQHGGDFHLDDPPRSYFYEPDDRPATSDEIYIVSQPFVDLDLDGVSDRWLGTEHHGRFVSIRSDATIQLLTLRPKPKRI